jgi:nitroreductase
MPKKKQTDKQDLSQWTPVEEVIFKRRSIRAFKKDPLPDFMIRRILEAGRFAPSAGNAQPWKFIVVKSPEILAEMEKDAVKITKVLMWFIDYTRSPMRRLLLKPLTKVFIRLNHNQLHPVPMGLLRSIANDECPVFHHAPTLILLLEDRRGVSSPPTDIGICGQNMVLTAHGLGAGSCWLGMIKLLMYYPKWKKFFGVKYPYKLNDCIAVGWPKVKADDQVPREKQMVQWFVGGLETPPRIEIQGE